MRSQTLLLAATIATMCAAPAPAAQAVKLADGTMYLDLERAARAVLGDRYDALAKDPKSGKPAAEFLAAVENLAASVPAGGAIYLGGIESLDARRVQDGVAIQGDGRRTVRLAGGQQGISTYDVDLAIEPGKGPLRDLTMLFGHCGRIEGDVVGSDFISAVNAWAAYGFKAAARIDDCLFLFFSTNWTFADYNAHLKKPDADWWKKNCQCHFDLKGGGKNTRIYLMVETNYGNPGTGIWLENCDGLALYHGATERASSQGPGVYYLKNCRHTTLGLRRIFPGSRGGDKPGIPTHALTIEGGSDNVLHMVSDFANAYGESLVNGDPRLRIWGASFDYEAAGVDRPEILKFAFTPLENVPQGADVEKAAKLAAKNAGPWTKRRAAVSGWADTPENVTTLTRLIERGRDAWWPLNARHEVTFSWAGKDLTAGPAGVAVPAPPSMPATDAPRTFRPLYFTWAPDFGKALLAAGADPTGKRPSDDAFAKVMFGMSAAEAHGLIAAATKGDAAAFERLYPPTEKGKPGKRVKRPRIEIPAGTFLLTKTLLVGPDGAGLLGAGPDRTILRFQGDVPCIRQVNPCGIRNLAIEGGRVGIDVTGADHGADAGPLQKAYIAGDIYYNLAFRGQSFAGIHVGDADIGRMGGAEHDQNRYVNLTFHDTGDYGIYFNNGMLDKWLLLNAEFKGQKKAGVSIKHNNLIHGWLANCRFENIDGPGIDFMGGNATLGFRPYIVAIDQCEFLECGTASQPALDYGYCELAALARTSIVTKTKAIKAGLVGCPQICEDVTVDVNLADGGSAVVLRGVRNGQTARVNGHILRGVKASGPVTWINDANAHNALYDKTLEHYKAGKFATSANLPGVDKAKLELDWDTNAAAHDLAPPNGWVHPYLFYDCTFGAKSYGYSLLNVDVDKGVVLAEVPLTEAK